MDKFIEMFIFGFNWFMPIWEGLNKNVIAIIVLWMSASWVYEKVSKGYIFKKYSVRNFTEKFGKIRHDLIISVKKNQNTNKTIKIIGLLVIIYHENKIGEVFVESRQDVEIVEDDLLTITIYLHEDDKAKNELFHSFSENLWLVLYDIHDNIYCISRRKKPFLKIWWERKSIKRKLKSSRQYRRMFKQPKYIPSDDYKLRILHHFYKIKKPPYYFYFEVKNSDTEMHYFAKNKVKNGILHGGSKNYRMIHVTSKKNANIPDGTLEIPPLGRARLKYKLDISPEEMKEIKNENFMFNIINKFNQQITDLYFLRIE